MISPAAYNISIQQNASFDRSFQLKDGTGTPINMTGYSVKASLWSAGKHQKFTDFTFAWVDQPTGQFKISLPATATAVLGEDGVWDLLVTNPDGSKDYWLRGAATVETGYTT